MSRRFDAVVVTDLSRLSRSQGDLSKTIDRLTAKGIRVIGVQDGYDSARRGHKLQAGLAGNHRRGVSRDGERSNLCGVRKPCKGSSPTGGLAYGYRDGKVDRGEAFMVREIFGTFTDGLSARTIAADLNERRIPSPG